ncbi:hypothetical protein ACHAXA_002004, partial [Cyclostephanos tholiformis]
NRETAAVVVVVAGGRDDDDDPASSRDGGGYVRRRLLTAAVAAGEGIVPSSYDESDDRWFRDVPLALSLAIGSDAFFSSVPNRNITSSSSPHGGGGGGRDLRVLLVITSLVEYDRGTRGTTLGRDRLMEIVLPQIVLSVESMSDRGWAVDVYLILGYPSLEPNRRRVVRDALPITVGLEIWEDAIPLHYAKTYNKERPGNDQRLTTADHALSRQHRYVLRDKLPYYDFFACFEDDMRITANHVINFLEISASIKRIHDSAEASPDRHAHVVVAEHHRSDNGGNNRTARAPRHRPNDGASVGNDVANDPISAEHVRRLFPGFIRVEVLDRMPDHPLRISGILDDHLFAREVPRSADAFLAGLAGESTSVLRPTACCGGDNDRDLYRPRMDEVVMWETNVQATGVREYPHPLGWVAAMPVEDRADVGSYWSGHPDVYGAMDMKRPRRLDSTLGQQAGFMATRGQIEYFHDVACPGGFLPPYDDVRHWKGDSLQRHSVEFWSGGFQVHDLIIFSVFLPVANVIYDGGLKLFGQCFLNRILSLDPKKFERQLLYHVTNNKQRTISPRKMIRVGDYYGQLITVKERAEKFLRAEAA